MTMKPVIFIDGREGTTGLQIYDRLTPRQDIELLLIDEEKRKDPAERKKCLNAADLVFLCLPDDAAREAVAMIENPNTKVIDASTAHRTAEGWAYGFPELSPKHREAIIHSKRVANPGCHASGFISSVYPLVQLGLIPPDHPLCAYSLTGYSGGGKKLIAEYQDPNRDPRHESARNAPPQAPARNGPRLRPGRSPRLPPHLRRLHPGHGHHRHAPQRHPARRTHGI